MLVPNAAGFLQSSCFSIRRSGDLCRHGQNLTGADHGRVRTALFCHGLQYKCIVMLSGSQDLHVKKQVWHWYISQAPLTGDWLTVSPFFDSQRGHVFIANSSFLIDSLSPSVFVPTLLLSAENQAAANNGLLFPARQVLWRQESFCVSSLPDQTPGQAEERTGQE